MKKFLGLTAVWLCCFFSNEVKASHYSAGELFYKWIGNEPGKGPLDYRVFGTIYRNVNGATIGTGNLTACAFRTSGSSSLGMTLIYQNPNSPLNPDYVMTSSNPYGWVDIGRHPNDNNGWAIPEFDACAASNKDISEYRYVGEVTLDSYAADWHFAIDPPCCRDASDNLIGSTGSDFYIEVDLNNQTKMGPNSSPRILTPASKAFCVVTANQKAFEWAQTAAETDGDSLTYRFATTGSLDGDCPGNWSQIPFVSPYTASDPFPSNPPVTIDQNLGVFTMSPSATGSFMLKFEVYEQRFDTVQLQWLTNGNMMREVQIQVAGACNVTTQSGPKLDLTQSNTSLSYYQYLDRDSMELAYNMANILGHDSTTSLVQIPLYSGYQCFNDSILLTFDIPVKCKTVDPTDFRLVGPDGVARPIYNVRTNCLVTQLTSTLTLDLYKPLDENGNYILQIKRGNDGTTLENECGFEIREFYSAIIEVNDCPIPAYSAEGVTVTRDQYPKITWDVNDTTSTFFTLDSVRTKTVFNYWAIYRKNWETTDPYNEIGRVYDFDGRTFSDSLPEDWYVDLSIWDYKVELISNEDKKGKTRPVNTVRMDWFIDSLDGTYLSPLMSWNRYFGCDSSARVGNYRVYDAEIDSIAAINGPDWRLVTDLISGVDDDTSYLYQKYTNDSLLEGESRQYAVMVEAICRDTITGDSLFTSRSNWKYYWVQKDSVIIPPPPPEDTPKVYVEWQIPNIFTPNGDYINDRFYLFVTQFSDTVLTLGYPEISIRIFNRNGIVVFEDSQFQDRNSAADGWDGTDMNTGNTLTDGVYFYIIEMTDPAGISEKVVRQGHLTINGTMK